MDNKPVVACDMDDTIFEFVIPILDKYNLRYNDFVSYGDITNWNIHKFLKPECKNVFEEFVTEGFFEELFIPVSTVGWLSALSEIANIRFVTAGCSKTIPWRAELLKRELDFFEDSMLIKLSDKELLMCDYLIDDNPITCMKAVQTIPFVDVMQIKRPWNDDKGYEIDEALSKIAIDILRRRDV